MKSPHLRSWFSAAVVLLGGCLLGPSAAAAELPADPLEASSAFWPPFAQLVTAVETPSGTLTAPRRGVLIRLEAPSNALIDFGRQGVQQVPLEATDILTRMQAIASGAFQKRLPNLVEMLGPRLLRDDAGQLRRMKLVGEQADAEGIEWFLFVYAADAPGTLERVAADYADVAPGWGEAGVLPVLVPLSPIGDGALRERLAAHALDDFWQLYDFVTPGYINALRHDPEGPLTYVLCDKDGRLVGRARPGELAALTAFLSSSPSSTESALVSASSPERNAAGGDLLLSR